MPPLKRPTLSRTTATLLGAGTLAAAAACSDPLSVDNRNNPDVARVYGSAVGVETIVSKLFQQVHQGLYGSATNMSSGAQVMAFESASQLGNYCMGTFIAIPRAPVDNSPGSPCEDSNFRIFSQMSRQARGAADAITAIDAFVEAGQGTGTTARDARVRSVAWFNLAVATGHAALMYDSVAAPTPGLGPQDVPPLQDAAEVMALVLQQLDSAQADAEAVPAASFTIPATWLGNEATMTRDNYLRVIRSFRARFRAGVARTPEERAAVDWDKVIADATNGITGDFVTALTSSNGWSNAQWNQLAVDGSWSQMPPWVIGMADTSGAYEAWLAAPLQARGPFLIVTPDRRFPAGETRLAQQTSSGSASGSTTPGTARQPPGGINGKPYIRNRASGEDFGIQPWATSYYDYYRFFTIRTNSGTGTNLVLLKAENDMLAAEGHIRKNQGALARALINTYRTANNLPAITSNDVAAPVPGGSACVPRVPAPPTFQTAQCGNMMEAMKYEKRIETAMSGFAQWFVDGRGWGDLVEGTPLEWPVPYSELDARTQPHYFQTTYAARGTYGW